jgi:hypothetical protein
MQDLGEYDILLDKDGGSGLTVSVVALTLLVKCCRYGSILPRLLPPSYLVYQLFNTPSLLDSLSTISLMKNRAFVAPIIHSYFIRSIKALAAEISKLIYYPTNY